MTLPRSARGRPPKYGRPSRVVTLTLPVDVLARLAAVDADLGRAIVTVAESLATGRSVPATQPAEVSSYGRQAVIVVTALKALKRLRGVQLVPIGGGRALISLEPPHSVLGFEVEIRDVLERAEVEGSERQALEVIAKVLAQARRSRRVSLKQRTIIVLESKRRRRLTTPDAPASASDGTAASLTG